MQVCIPCLCSAHRDQKRMMDLLELELKMVVRYHMGTDWELNLGPLQNNKFS